MARGLALRLRESPRVRRERIERVARALAMLVVPQEISGRPEVLFGRVVHQGLSEGRKKADDVSGAVLEAAAVAAIAAISEFDNIDVNSLRSELQKLRAYLPLQQQVGPETIARMHEARARGETWKSIAEEEDLPVERVRYLLGAKKRGGSPSIALSAPEDTGAAS